MRGTSSALYELTIHEFLEFGMPSRHQLLMMHGRSILQISHEEKFYQLYGIYDFYAEMCFNSKKVIHVVPFVWQDLPEYFVNCVAINRLY